MVDRTTIQRSPSTKRLLRLLQLGGFELGNTWDVPGNLTAMLIPFAGAVTCSVSERVSVDVDYVPTGKKG